MSELADKVRAAADYIERVGLYKGSLYDTNKWFDEHPSDTLPEDAEVVAEGYPCCTIGALLGFDANEARRPLADFLDLSHPFGGDRIPQWNDAEERTQDEVVTALRRFADTLGSGA